MFHISEKLMQRNFQSIFECKDRCLNKVYYLKRSIKLQPTFLTFRNKEEMKFNDEIMIGEMKESKVHLSSLKDIDMIKQLLDQMMNGQCLLDLISGLVYSPFFHLIP